MSVSLVINTSNDTTANLTLPASFTCDGGVMSPQGAIYGFPYITGGVLKIVPDGSGGGTASTVAAGAGLHMPAAHALAFNGCIYTAPSYSASSNVYVYNPANDTLVATVATGITGQWCGGVLAPNGNIYSSPFSGTTAKVLVITPTGSGASASCTVSGITVATGYTFSGGCLAPNGLIYFAPTSGSSGPLVVDPVAATATVLPGSLTKYVGAVAHSSGVYLIPDYTNSTPICVTDGFLSVPTNFLLSPYWNKF